MEHTLDLLPLLDFVPAHSLNYTDWLAVGMGLKEAGYTWEDWDVWSQNDARYHAGDCRRKWDSFVGTETPVTGGTIVQMAKGNGWRQTHGEGYELSWDAEIGAKDYALVDNTWLEGQELSAPTVWSPAKELIRYLEILFEASENVGYVTESWNKDGKYLPTKGSWDRTAGQLIEQLSACHGDIASVLGDYKEEAGAWIRFNPLDGRGVKNENVTEYRYALVESDTMELEKQNALIRELELPVACLVHSGKKSLHAIVKIDAADYGEYRKRVDYLYTVLKASGMDVDTQNKNPSRLSRMPGVRRNGQHQYIVDANFGKSDFKEWQSWIESLNDHLPDTENLSDIWGDLPALAPPLIDGVLRQGHKMLIAGPSKAGKSYALIELCCAIAEGMSWLGFSCARGRVLYVNLELDRASCLHRFKDVYQALGWAPTHLQNLDIWNLRGKSVPMDKLAPKLIRRAMKKNYIAIVIDPIYKVITGDENSADQMANFCNQFDKVCTELGCAVIYCHHHSKGGQGGKKSMDRVSGSGVFARDPDAMIDLIELELTDSIQAQGRQTAAAQAYAKQLEMSLPNWEEVANQDDLCSEKVMYGLCKEHLSTGDFTKAKDQATIAQTKADARTAWRIEGTLREFPKFPAINVWFRYPIHLVDDSGTLGDIDTGGSYTAKGAPWKKNFGRKQSPQEREAEKKTSVETAFEACGFTGSVTVKGLSEYMGVSEDTVRRRIKNHGGFWVDNGNVGKK